MNCNTKCNTNVWKSLLKFRMMKEGEEKLKEAAKKQTEGGVAPWIEIPSLVFDYKKQKEIQIEA